MGAICKVISVLCIGVTTVLCGCTGSNEGIDKIVAERDSLRNVAEQTLQRMAYMDTLVFTINRNMDSIVMQENGIFINGISESGDVRQTALSNVNRIADLISKQKNEIKSLEDKLKNDNQTKDDAVLQGLVENYKRQLAQKDQQIAALRDELSRKDADISALRVKTANQLQKIAELDKRSQIQQDALKRQDAILNQCYMVVGTKKELEKDGIIKKGKIVAQSALDRSKFSKVDIRRFVEMSFNAKRPKILTPMPESSYEITTDGNHNFTLTINNPTAFWKVSNYLVIQTD